MASGLSVTAWVITAAAAIMICLLLAFVALPDPVSKQFGLGLAVAIFIDATLVRLMLVTATMELLGGMELVVPILVGPHSASRQHRGHGDSMPAVAD